MSLKKAKEIVGQMALHVFDCMDIPTEKPSGMLCNLSLEDLIKANKRVVRHNKEQEQKPFVDGKRSMSFQVTMDDRLIAALYAAYHYEPSTQEAKCKVGDKYLYVLHSSDIKHETED